MLDKKLEIKEGLGNKGGFTLSENFSLKGNNISLIEKFDNWLAEQSKVDIKDKVIFYRLLSTMVGAGMTLIEALEVLKDQLDSPKLKIIIKKITNRVSSGSSFSDSMKLFPDVFKTSEYGIIKAGEKSGKLNLVLKNLASQVENSAKLKGKIKGAMMYPIVILIIVSIAISAIMVFVIPQIKDMFESMGVQLPLATQILIKSSDFLTSTNFLGINNLLMIIIYLFLIFLLFIYFIKTKKGAYYFNLLVLKIPLFGNLVQKMIISQFCRGLSILIGSGLSLIDALILVSEMLGNEAYRRRILKTVQDVKQGLTISQNMKKDFIYFPPMLVSMIAVGEKTAQLEEVTKKVAEFYEDEVDTIVKNLMTLLEPIIIVVVGGIVGGIIIAVMLPILSLSDLAGV